MDMIGQSVYEYSHPCDHDEIRECFSIKKTSDNAKRACNFFLRLKCTLTNKGRKVNLKSASYKVIHCTGHLVENPDWMTTNTSSEKMEIEDDSITEAMSSLVIVGCPVPHPSNIEVPLGRHTFLTKHSLNMKFTYADEKLAEFLGWDSQELVGQSIFDFHHALDNMELYKDFKSLFNKGQCETIAYRFLGKKGGYAWVITQATLIRCAKQHKPLSVVCVNYILSGIECENEVYSTRQLEARTTNIKQKSAPLITLVEELAPLEIPESLPVLESVPQTVTASLIRLQENPKKESKVPFPRSQPDAGEIFDQKENRQERKREATRTSKRLNDEKNVLRSNKNSAVGCNTASNLNTDRQSLEILANNSGSYGFGSSLSNQPFYDDFLPLPQTNTASIFAPRTEDMNKGFLTFSEDQPGLTMLKDEPEDLTHLAPVAGDVCVPLEDTPFLTDMLDEFILSNESYCPLLSPDIPTDIPSDDPLSDSAIKDSRQNSTQNSPNSKATPESLPDFETKDPFMYRDSISRCSVNTGLHSPTLSKSSERSIDSMYSSGKNYGSGGCGDSCGGGGLSEDEMLMLSISDVMGDDEMTLRAPYIPMSDQDEALQLLISDDMVMWGPTQSSEKHKWSNDPGEESTNSNLARLLKNDADLKKVKIEEEGLINPSQVLEQIDIKDTQRESPTITADTSHAPCDRATKRVHVYSEKSESLKKRLKSSESKDVTGEYPSASSAKGSQLLQQLVSQQSPKARWSHPLETGDFFSSRAVSKNCSGAQKKLEEKLDLADSGGGNLDDEGGGGVGGGGGSGGGGDDDGSVSEIGKNLDGVIGAYSTETTNSRQSNSVLMNLLVSGCDVSAGYVCLAKPKPSKGIASK